MIRFFVFRVITYLTKITISRHLFHHATVTLLFQRLHLERSGKPRHRKVRCERKADIPVASRLGFTLRPGRSGNIGQVHSCDIASWVPPCAAINMATADRQYDSISLSSSALAASKRAIIRRSEPLKSAANKRAD